MNLLSIVNKNFVNISEGSVNVLQPSRRLHPIVSLKQRYIVSGVITILTFILSGCVNNVVYLDVDTETLVPCGTSRITSVTLEDENHRLIRLKAKWEVASATLPLRIVPEQYQINVVFEDENTFTLLPNMTYIVEHSTHGDAGMDDLTFRTDATGKIISASRTACD
ncbi:hypothetical protein [Neolewinella antarctica]|uniref:Lipoprotein n=1 Tax=Neolewinella antarctica TaxID=442734 RepID=A0ABX0XA78_9BACT|nr:hypothetical protein [Neolewinella antarctica]NJC25955.1 hypothetical protein [Neolewinella antarctica]